jgi:hypothetical protein
MYFDHVHPPSPLLLPPPPVGSSSKQSPFYIHIIFYIKRIQKEKKEVNLSLFTDDIILKIPPEN